MDDKSIEKKMKISITFFVKNISFVFVSIGNFYLALFFSNSEKFYYIRRNAKMKNSIV